MPRTYQKKEGVKRLLYTQDDVAHAVIDVEAGASVLNAAKKYNIPYETLRRRIKVGVANPGKSGRNTALLMMEERTIAEYILLLSKYGLVFSTLDLRNFIKKFLDCKQRIVPEFKDNLPGIDWVYGFLSRNKDITQRHCQNISLKRACISVENVSEYFQRLKDSIAGVKPQNIINYDETNFTDDPGTKLLFQKGIKRAEREMNTSKASVSVMFSGTASGIMLPPYVVYKGEKLLDTYVFGGPLNAQYNVSKSGWFDGALFLDFLDKVIIPFFRRTPKDEMKILIGDNLPSHMSIEAVEKCVHYNIHFVFLPPNSTHLLQPLDVVVFHPMKVMWRKILQEFKQGKGRTLTTLPKQEFPILLLNLLQNMEHKLPQLLIKGFKNCGIHPLNPNIVIKQMKPSSPSKCFRGLTIPPILVDYLKEREKSHQIIKRKRGRRINVQPGEAVSSESFTESPSPQSKTKRTKSTSCAGIEVVASTSHVCNEGDSGVVSINSAEVKCNDLVLVKFENEKKMYSNAINMEESVWIENEIKIEEEEVAFEGEDDIPLSHEADFQKMNSNSIKFEIDVKEEIKEEEVTFEDEDDIPLSSETDFEDPSIEERYKQNGDTSAFQELREEETTTEKQDRKKIRCFNCNLIFGSIDELGRHMESLCERRHKCSQRGCGSNCESDLKSCLLNSKSSDKSDIKRKLFKCSECNYECNRKGDLKIHALKHQNIKLFKCSKCNYECNKKGDLNRHLLTHENVKLFKCSQCNYGCNQKRHLRVHLLTHENIKLFKCSYCSYECNQKGHLKRHLLTHGNVKLFKCSECSYECNQKGNLKNHLLTHTNIKLFKCSECNYACNAKRSLQFHMLKHQSMKLFKCSQCDFESNYKEQLKVHLLTHENIKLFHCSECNFECNRKGVLKNHILTHKKVKLFKCSECNYECNRNWDLKRHSLTHGNIKLFKCSFCNYKCNEKSYLKIHILNHQNIKLFKCSECNYSSNRKNRLKSHLQTHESIQEK